MVIHPALAPYRVDFFNSLNKEFDASFYFLNENLLNQKFDQKKLKKEVHFKCNHLNKGFNIFGRSFRFGLFSILKKEEPDMVFLPEYNVLNLTVILYRIVFKKSFEIYSICDDNISVANKASVLKKIIRRIQLKYLTGVILTHQEVVNWYKQHLKPSCKLLIFPIIREDKRFYKQLNNSVPIAQSYIEKYRLKDRKTLLFVGRLVAVKNLNRLIEAFKIVQIKNKDITLIIVGSGELEPQLKKMVRDFDLTESVIFPGRFEEEELLAWYLTAGVFILPSISETFGAVINEALLAGNYVLASRLTGGSALLNENVNGNTFNPYDKSEIADLILKTLKITKLFENQGEVRPSRMLMDYNTTFSRFVKQLRTK